MSTYEPEGELVEVGAQALRELINAWGRGEANADLDDQARAVLREAGPMLLARGWDEGWMERARRESTRSTFSPEVLPPHPNLNPYREEAS